MVYGGERCVLNNLYPVMTFVRACAGVYGTIDGCVIVPIDTSFHDNIEIMHGIIFQPTHRGLSYICFPSHVPPMIATLSVPKTLNSAYCGHMRYQ